MRYKLVDAVKAYIPISRAYGFLGVNVSGYYTWASRGASKRQLDDMVLPANIRESYVLSNETYGSPHMTAELKEAGFEVGPI